MKASDFDLSPQRLDCLFDRPTDSADRSLTVREFVFGNYPSGLVKPSLVLVGGQPGAGKSVAMAMLARERVGELVPLSGDDLRPFHDHFEQLARENPWLLSNATAQASGAWVRRCIDYALTHRYSLLLEGVFRDPLTVANTIDRFADASYQVEVVGVATPYRDSLLATLGRFLHPDDHIVPRWTPATAHDSAYHMLPSTMQAAEDTPGTHLLRVTNRDGTELHTRSADQWVDPTPGAAAAATKRERDKPPSPEIARTWLHLYVEHTRELAHRGQIGEATRPTLDRLMRQADYVSHIAYPNDVPRREAIAAHGIRLQETPQASTELPPVRLPPTLPPADTRRSATSHELDAVRRAQMGLMRPSSETSRPTESSERRHRSSNRGPDLDL